MDQLLFGKVLQRIPLIPGQAGIHDAWLAQVLVEEESMGAIIKCLPARELYVECLCALLGRAAGLQIPRPLVVSDDELGVAFGSEQLPHPDLRHTVRPSAIWTEQLAAWPALPRAAAFDAWVANADRNEGNLLTDGQGQFWLIDHGEALPSGLSPDAVTDNKLLAVSLCKVTTSLQRRRLLTKLTEALRLLDGALPGAACAELPRCPPDLLRFLQARHPHLWPLLRERVTCTDELAGF